MDIALFKMKPDSFAVYDELDQALSELNRTKNKKLTDVTQVAETIDNALKSNQPIILEKLDLYLGTLSEAQIIFLSFLSDELKNYRLLNEIAFKKVKSIR